MSWRLSIHIHTFSAFKSSWKSWSKRVRVLSRSDLVWVRNRLNCSRRKLRWSWPSRISLMISRESDTVEWVYYIISIIWGFPIKYPFCLRSHLSTGWMYPLSIRFVSETRWGAAHSAKRKDSRKTRAPRDSDHSIRWRA